MISFRYFIEGVRQAFQQLNANRMRSALSILGITIGIFCIVAVQSAINSLKTDIKGTFDSLGKDVVYVDIFPWDGTVNENNYRKYLKRPQPDFDDLEAIQNRSKLARAASLAFFVGGKTIKHKSKHVNGALVVGVTEEYPDIISLNLEKGRFFSATEYKSGENRAVIGHDVAEELFGNLDPIGEKIKLLGRKYQVTGVLAKEGESLFSFIEYDESVLLSSLNFQKSYVINDKSDIGRLFNVAPKPGFTSTALKEEITGILRSERRLRPAEPNDFALNEQTTITRIVDQLFGKINIGGVIIGMFALFIGMFGIANIMFVSVNERTKMIGIKKALGATQGVILLEFLIEAVVLSVLGGIVGIFVVVGLITLINSLESVPWEFTLSMKDFIIGLSLSTATGVIAGLIPAYIAAKKDPVVAIRK